MPTYSIHQIQLGALIFRLIYSRTDCCTPFAPYPAVSLTIAPGPRAKLSLSSRRKSTPPNQTPHVHQLTEAATPEPKDEAPAKPAPTAWPKPRGKASTTQMVNAQPDLQMRTAKVELVHGHYGEARYVPT